MIDPKNNPVGFVDFCLRSSDEYLTDTEQFKTDCTIETRTRKNDVTDALRFRVHDPLWMLSRQWQMGEFKGNNAGTAMSVRCKVKSSDITSFSLGEDKKNSITDTSGIPIEPLVEQIDREITPLVRIESATYFIDLIDKYPDNIKDKKYFVNWLRTTSGFRFKEDELSFSDRGSLENKEIKDFTESLNTRLSKFQKAYYGKACDGYKLYKFCKNIVINNTVHPDIPVALAKEYSEWFEKRYLPKSGSASAWNVRELGYDFAANNAVAEYKAEDYEGGRVSWYSFDTDRVKSSNNIGRMKEEIISTLPTLATYPGSPNKRLWEFEDRKVFMGNSTSMNGKQAKGNVVFLQYATMYANDWMICPLKTEVGKYIEVKEIQIRDTFGFKTRITSRAGAKDNGAKTFGQQWQIFTNAPSEPDKGSSTNGLLFPPSLINTLEGEPLEEVSILRDEMANMVWAVERKVEDGCGSSLDADYLASKVGEFIDEKYNSAVEKAALTITNDKDGNTEVKSSRETDYKYILMTSVPLNWIPFVPQHFNSEQDRKQYDCFQGGGRETVLRRGKMPRYFIDDSEGAVGKYFPVRPLSSILKVEMNNSGNEVPFFINEEQVQGVGTLVLKNCQRSRWIGGKTYNWMGYSMQIKHTQGVSGLEYDNLVEPTR